MRTPEDFNPSVIQILLDGYLLGWLVAWPPGPINTEMLRRVVQRGFWAGWVVGAGACTGDFCWALVVGLGAGAVATPAVITALGWLSVALLLGLGATFLRGGGRAWRAQRAGVVAPVATGALETRRGGFLLGWGMAMLSPWNIAFWLAVIGQQATGKTFTPGTALALASAVIAGALTWSVVYCGALQRSARWITPTFQIWTQLITGLLLIAFAARTVLRLLA